MMMKHFPYKWRMLALVSALYFLAQGTRQVYNAALPAIQSGLGGAGHSDLKMGLVGSVFTLVFGLVVPFAGLAADRFSRKRIILLGAIVFSLGVGLCGFASGLVLLVVAYGLLNAAGQALLPPCNSSLISQFHVETRGTAFSLYQVAIYLGSILLAWVAGALCETGPTGWRLAFWIFGGVGLLYAAVLGFALEDTPLPGGGRGATALPLKNALGAFITKPTVWLLIASCGAYIFIAYGVKLWMPMYVSRTFPNLSLGTAAFHAVFWMYLGAFLGALAGGRLSDRLRPRWSAIRLEVEAAGHVLIVPSILLLAFASSLPLMAIGLFLFGFATGVYDSNFYAALLEVVPARNRAAATGVFGCGASVIGAFGPGVMGAISGSFSMRAAIGSLALFAALGLVFLVVARCATFKRDAIQEQEEGKSK